MLKKCPMCGKKPKDDNIIVLGLIDGRKQWLECDCGLKTSRFKDRNELEKYWNTRKVD